MFMTDSMLKMRYIFILKDCVTIPRCLIIMCCLFLTFSVRFIVYVPSVSALLARKTLYCINTRKQPYFVIKIDYNYYVYADVISRSNCERTTKCEAECPGITQKRFNSTSERRLYYMDHVPKVPPSSPTNFETR